MRCSQAEQALIVSSDVSSPAPASNCSSSSSSTDCPVVKERPSRIDCGKISSYSRSVPRRAGLLPLELAILQLAATEPEFHGFAAARALRDAHGGGLTAHGTLYKALSRLAGGGLLAARWEPPGDAEMAGRPRRRLYRITDAGRAALIEAAATERPASPVHRAKPRTATR